MRGGRIAIWNVLIRAVEIAEKGGPRGQTIIDRLNDKIPIARKFEIIVSENFYLAVSYL